MTTQDDHSEEAPNLPLKGRPMKDLRSSSRNFGGLKETVDRMKAWGIEPTSPFPDPKDFQVPEIDFTPDDSPQRTAEHTESMASTMADMLEVTRTLAMLTETNLEQSKKAERRTFWLTIASLAISFASAGAAITSVFLYLTTTG